MPFAPPKVCCRPGCNRLTQSRFCPEHAVQHSREETLRIDARRGSSTQRGYTYRWQKYAKAFLNKPENAICKVAGCNRPSQVVDHVIPHKGDQALFWDHTNHQGLCKHHHDEKTAREDGGFGRAVGKTQDLDESPIVS